MENEVPQENLSSEIKPTYAEVTHAHTGDDSAQIRVGDLWDNLDVFETVTVAPSTIPRNNFQKIKLYSSGGTTYLYTYDSNLSAWRYIKLT